jgi:hypothetical protein
MNPLASTSVGVAIGQDASRARAEISRPSGAAASTVEALIFGLRDGLAALPKNPERLRRLSELNAEQLCAVCERLQNFQTHIAPAWTPNEVKALVAIWNKRHV